MLISHRVAAIKDADQILVLDQGKVVERGTHDELIAAGGVYSELLPHPAREPSSSVAGGRVVAVAAPPRKSGPRGRGRCSARPTTSA